MAGAGMLRKCRHGHSALTIDWLSTDVVNSFSCSTGMVLLRFTILAIMPPSAGVEADNGGMLASRHERSCSHVRCCRAAQQRWQVGGAGAMGSSSGSSGGCRGSGGGSGGSSTGRQLSTH